jgi:hypothetical protein
LFLRGDLECQAVEKDRPRGRGKRLNSLDEQRSIVDEPNGGEKYRIQRLEGSSLRTIDRQRTIAQKARGRIPVINREQGLGSG